MGREAGRVAASSPRPPTLTPRTRPAGPGPVQPAQPGRVGGAVLRASGAGAPAHRVLRGPQAQGGAVVQHDRALLQVQLRPRPTPTAPAPIGPAHPAGPAPPPPASPGLYLRTQHPHPTPIKPTWGPLKVARGLGLCVVGRVTAFSLLTSLTPLPPLHLPPPVFVHHSFAPFHTQTSFALVMFLTPNEHLDLFIVRFFD